MFFKINVVTNESRYSIKIKFILSIHFPDEHIFGKPQSHVDQKQPQRRTIKFRRRKKLPTYTIPNINATIEKIFTRKYSNYRSQSQY